MKYLIPILALVFAPVPVFAENYYRPGGSGQSSCYKDVYREEYVPGTRNSPGYVRRRNERVEVPCENTSYYNGGSSYYEDEDDNSCVEGSIIGGIAGGAAGGTLSTQENWIWSIPAGIIGGALVGCQIDGG